MADVKIRVLQKILNANDQVAAGLRAELTAAKVFSVNLMGSPGSGKTAIIEETVRRLNKKIAVIEGDIQTSLDAQRLQKLGIKTYQINTGPFGGDCHLEAAWIRSAVAEMGVRGLDLLFIENIGNLVCPAEFDTGAHLNVLALSVTEGEDKPLKYPLAFRVAAVCLVSKIDLLPHLKIDVEKIRANILQVNPQCRIMEISALTGQGFEPWLEVLISGC